MRRRRLLSTSFLLATSLTTTAAAVWTPPSATAAPATVADGDWLGIVNAYRDMSGVDPVVADATWSEQARAHSCYMVHNGLSHDEVPGRKGYTAGGAEAGRSGNVSQNGPAATARSHIDTWMAGPFHAIGLLRPGLTTTGFGSCGNAGVDMATIDIYRGLDTGRPAPVDPIVFPGDGATVSLDRFVAESPDPMSMCGWSGDAGLPLIAMMPSAFSSASATITGPGGSVATCVLHGGNVSDPLASSIMSGSNAVVVVPRTILNEGTYQVEVATSSGSVGWSFAVDRDASLQPPDPTPATEASGGRSTFEAVTPFRLVDTRIAQGSTRLGARSTTRIEVADASVTAVSANFVTVDPADNGYLTAFDCTNQRPTVSNINYRAGTVVANQTVVPLQDGHLCLFSRAATDVVIDVNGFYRTSTSGERFVATASKRLFDTRSSTKVTAGRSVAVPVTGVPASATAVALNVTAINAPDRGWIKVTPCGRSGDATISSLNYVRNEVRSNSAVVPIGTNRSICVTSLRTMDVTIDIAGYFTTSGGGDFQALSPIRLLDTRETNAELNPKTRGARLGAGQVVRIPVAGTRGVPARAEVASINIAATAPTKNGAITAYPCGSRPATPNLNVSTAQNTIANGAIVGLAADGDLCLHASADVHVIVDINGVWY